ncbi:hypothetical protein [Rhodococcus sp. 27YEA6]|uniref:hypothetical protein n=1 Tax=Rhodococcus sp. 27YEA6 TaxID=3156273 RepID=UPI0038333C8C
MPSILPRRTDTGSAPLVAADNQPADTQRSRPSLPIPHTIALPFVVTPVAPGVEQNEPGFTVPPDGFGGTYAGSVVFGGVYAGAGGTYGVVVVSETCGTSGTIATVVVVGGGTIVVVVGKRDEVVVFVVDGTVLLVVVAAAVVEEVAAGVVDSSDLPAPVAAAMATSPTTAAPAIHGHLRRVLPSSALVSGTADPGAPKTCVGVPKA